MNTRNRRTIVVMLVVLAALNSLASAAVGSVDVAFHVITKTQRGAVAPIELSFPLGVEDAERTGDLTYSLTVSSSEVTVQVSTANGTGKTMTAALLGNELRSGEYLWYAVTVWPDGRTTTTAPALLTVRD